MNDHAAIWWVIKGPVLASIMVRNWYTITHPPFAICVLFLYNCVVLFLFVYRSTLCCSLALSSSWFRNYSLQISEEMNPVFTCKYLVRAIKTYVLVYTSYVFNLFNFLFKYLVFFHLFYSSKCFIVFHYES